MQAMHPTSERVIEQKVEVSSTQKCGCDWRIGVVALAALATLTSLFLLPWPVTLSLGLASAAVITWLYLDCCVPSETLASCNKSFFGIFPSFGTVRTKETIYVEQPPCVHQYAERDLPLTRVQVLRARHPLQGRQDSSRKKIKPGGQTSIHPALGAKLAPPTVIQLSGSQPFPLRQPSPPPGAKLPPSGISSFSTTQPFPPRRRVELGGETSLFTPSSASISHSSAPPTSIEAIRAEHPVQGRQDASRERVKMEGQSSIQPPAGSKPAPQSIGATQKTRKRMEVGK